MTVAELIALLHQFKNDLFDPLAKKYMGTAEELRQVAEKASALILKAASVLMLKPVSDNAIKVTQDQIKNAIHNILKSFNDMGIEAEDLLIRKNKATIYLRDLLAGLDTVFKPAQQPAPPPIKLQASNEEKRKAAAQAHASFDAQAKKILANRASFLSQGLTPTLFQHYEEKPPLSHYEEIKQALRAKEETALQQLKVKSKK